MKRRAVKVPLGIQHLLLYLLLFTLPFFVLGYIIHFYLMESLENEVRLSNDEKLTKVKDFIDTKLVEFHNISSMVSKKREFTPSYLTNYHQVMRAKRFLNYEIGDKFIHEIFYYSRDRGYLFSYKTSNTIPIFLNNHYQFANWSANHFIQDISESKDQFMRSAEAVVWCYQIMNK